MRNICSTVQSGVAFLFVFLVSVSGQAFERFIDIKESVDARTGDAFNAGASPFKLAAGTKAEIIDFKYIKDGEMAFRVVALTGDKKGQKIWVRDFPSESKFDWFVDKQPSWKIDEGPRPQVAAPEFSAPEAPAPVPAPVTPTPPAKPTAPTSPASPEGKDAPAATAAATPPAQEPVNKRKGISLRSSGRGSPQSEVDPKHVVQVLDQANTSVKNVGSVQPQAPAPCTVCGKPDYPSNFAKCEGAPNGYYEKDLNRMAIEGSAIEQNLVNGSMNISRVTNPKCVHQLMTYDVGSYRYCDKGGSFAASVGRPCTSEKLFNLTYNSFEMAGHCLKGFLPGSETEDGFKRVMEMILAKNGLESSFHTNAVNPSSSAAGIAQFIPGGQSAIKDVNRRQLDAMRTKLTSHSDPQCKQIADKFLNKPMNESNICTAISVSEGNPLKNILYAMAYYKTAREDLDNNIFRPYAHKFTGLTEKEFEQYKIDVAIWAHNAGPGGMLYPMQYLVADISGEKRASYVELKEMTRRYMQRFPHRAYAGNTSLVNSTSNYLFDLEKKYAKVKATIPGNKCLL